MSNTNTQPAVPADDTELSHKEILEVLAGLLTGLFTAIISSTIVSSALPTIIADLDGSQTQYTWIVTASLLTMTVSTPIWGKLSDLFNKKRLIQLSLIIFVVGSVIAGAAHDVPTLLGARALQGVGMGGLTALAQSIIGTVIPPRQRGRYSGYMAATMMVATVSGPLLGGLITDADALGWRWCFYVCVPLAVVSLVMLHRYLRLQTIRREVKIDYLGAVLIGIAASLPLIWVSFAGNSFDWVSWQSAVMLGVSALAVVATVFVENRHPEPLVSMRVLRNRTTALAIVSSLAVGIAMFGGSVFLTQYFQVARGYSATEAGLLTIPLMVASAVATTTAGSIITRTGRWKGFLVGGSVLLIAGLGLLGTIDHTTPLWHMWIFMIAMGLGMGMLMQNLVLAVQNTVDVTEVGAASAAVAFFRSLGGAIGVSVLGAVLASRVDEKIASGLQRIGVDPSQSGGSANMLDVNNMPGPIQEVVRHAYGDGTGRIFLIGAIVAVASLIATALIKEVPLRTTVRKYDDEGNEEKVSVG